MKWFPRDVRRLNMSNCLSIILSTSYIRRFAPGHSLRQEHAVN